MTNTSDFTIQSSTCSAGTMAAGTVCEVQVKVHPISLGYKTGSIRRTCDDVGTKSITLAVTGVANSSVVQISAGTENSCLVQTDGTIKC